MNPDIAYMGEYLRKYKPPRFNLHKAVNYLFTTSVPSITMGVEFPDVSFWQGEIDFSVMAVKTKAIVLRAGQNTWVDTKFERNYTEAKKRGLLVGIYWFYDGRASPGEQAELLISLLGNKKLELEVFIDWEHNYGGAHEGLKNVVAMMQVVEQAGLDIKGVGLYTGYYFFRSNSNPITNASQYNYLKTRPLWEAWYTNNFAEVLVPAPWTSLTSLTIWQWGTPSRSWGQESLEIDMNLFNGTDEEFQVRYGQSTGEPMADYIELKSNTNANRTIRTPTAYPQTPHIAGGFLSSLIAGNTLRTSPQDLYVYAGNIRYTPPGTTNVYEAYAGDRWWRVVVGDQIGWIAEIHKGVRYLDVNEVSGEPTPTLPTLNIQLSDPDGNYPTINIEWKPNESTN
jgi:GH25 family lysozyme M1 (1,4-beta-N-acetylmuramidase)